MNKQFVLLAVATISLTPGFVNLALASTAFNTMPGWLISQAEQPKIDVAKLSIGGIKLGMTEKQVTKILGKPQTKQTVSRYITDGQLEQITSRSKSHGTKEGVRVGDPVSKATATYGKFQSEQNEKSTSYPNSVNGGLSFVTNSAGNITEIILVAASC
jgi:hypothetical protein